MTYMDFTSKDFSLLEFPPTHGKTDLCIQLHMHAHLCIHWFIMNRHTSSVAISDQGACRQCGKLDFNTTIHFKEIACIAGEDVSGEPPRISLPPARASQHVRREPPGEEEEEDSN